MGTGAAFDGAILASYTRTIVVTINYRLGPFGKRERERNMIYHWDGERMSTWSRFDRSCCDWHFRSFDVDWSHFSGRQLLLINSHLSLIRQTVSSRVCLCLPFPPSIKNDYSTGWMNPSVTSSLISCKWDKMKSREVLRTYPFIFLSKIQWRLSIKIRKRCFSLSMT